MTNRKPLRKISKEHRDALLRLALGPQPKGYEMGYKKEPISFLELRVANNLRQVEWPGSEGVDLCFRGLEMAGEAGELANKIKKLVRLQRGISGTTEDQRTLLTEICGELADVVICCDLIASDLGLGLGLAVQEKFNATSEKHGLKTMIRGES